ncbi:23S rRNA (uracil(1939)-C(5))-methyltransferase RlmD [Anaerorhabdus sp.]|uniref:23S rRNA (uracil(1939)-C(5))-methyltransferase RlmD n=1 Tax=Anaerorhabdus sp. TaxID=1872524 RepID=UPI002FC5E6E4
MGKTNVKIVKMGINGEGIGYINKVPVFVDGALLQEQVEIEITEKHQNYSKAITTKILQKSDSRVNPPCPFQVKCGGCSLMIADYKAQLEIKKELLRESLIKYAGLKNATIEDIVENPSPLHYRNQCKLPVKWLKGTLYSGLYEANSSRLLYMDECKVHEEGLDRVRKKIMALLNEAGIRDYNDRIERGMKYFVLRGFNGVYQCTLVTGRMTIEKELVDKIMEIKEVVSLFQNINTSKRSYEIFGKEFVQLGGSKTLELKMDGIVCRLSPASFFQLNVEQASKLYSTVVSLVDPCKLVVEAYSGIGVMSLLLKEKAERVVGIEYVKDAVKNANNNARINHCEDRVEFICGDAAEEMKNIAMKEKINALVVDPPRTGLNEEMLECIMKARPEQIIYISCNPATLAKNLNILLQRYRVERIIPFDMFSQTPHVETVVSLRLF